MVETREYPCTPDGMAAAQAYLESLSIEPKPAIVLDEIVSNIVRCSGAKKFRFGAGREEGNLVLVFADDGKPFDPTTEIAEPDVSVPLEERDVGGLGVFMVKKMAKSVAYAREGDRNVLTVRM